MAVAGRDCKDTNQNFIFISSNYFKVNIATKKFFPPPGITIA
jgi:hypothetical protein